MLRTLYGRMAAALLALFVVLACLLVAVQVWGTRRYQLEANQRLNRDLAANLVAQELLDQAGEVTSESLSHVFHTMMVVNPAIEVYLLDATGRILNFSAPPGRVKLEQVDLGPVRALLEGAAMLPVSIWIDTSTSGILPRVATTSSIPLSSVVLPISGKLMSDFAETAGIVDRSTAGSWLLYSGHGSTVS